MSGVLNRTAVALCGIALASGCTLPGGQPATTPAPGTALTPSPSASVATVAPARPTPALQPVKAVTLPPVVADGKGLDPRLDKAMAAATEAADKAGMELSVTSGYRSPAEQQALLDDAIKEYGSAEEASKWVMEPWQSMHVRGLAVDVGPTRQVQLWLHEHQEEFGLCRIYANEPWHFELKRGKGKCPELRASAAEE